MSTNSDYIVVVEDYAKRHYIKGFEKKFPTWDKTLSSLVEIFSRFDSEALGQRLGLLKYNRTKTKCLYKFEFREVSQTTKSHKTSGNRLVLLCDHDTKFIYILLVYQKSDIRGSGETTWLMGHINTEFDILVKTLV
jgi:hypothetical protein